MKNLTRLVSSRTEPSGAARNTNIVVDAQNGLPIDNTASRYSLAEAAIRSIPHSYQNYGVPKLYKFKHIKYVLRYFGNQFGNWRVRITLV